MNWMLHWMHVHHLPGRRPPAIVNILSRIESLDNVAIDQFHVEFLSLFVREMHFSLLLLCKSMKYMNRANDSAEFSSFSMFNQLPHHTMNHDQFQWRIMNKYKDKQCVDEEWLESVNYYRNWNIKYLFVLYVFPLSTHLFISFCLFGVCVCVWKDILRGFTCCFT